jgi:hypothetical protein
MKPTETTRRDFFRTVLRYGALGALGGLGMLAFRRRGTATGNSPCGLYGSCAECPSVSNCSLKPDSGGADDE